jgi:hypothetical protein
MNILLGLNTEQMWKCIAFLTILKYLYHKLPQIFSAYRNHNPVLSSFMIWHRIYGMGDAADAAGGIGTAYPFGVHFRSLWFVLLSRWSSV